jgi:ATP-binding cassette subfamily B protein
MSENSAAEESLRKRKSGWYLLWEYAREHPFIYFVAIASIGGSSILAVWIPRLIGQFTDTFKGGGLSLKGAERYALVILAVGIARVSFGWLGRVLAAQHGRIITYKVREKLFEKWESLSPAYYHGHSIGELLSHALSDVDVVRQVASMGINITVSGIFMLGAALYMMVLHMNWPLAIAGLGPLVAIPVLVRYYGPKIKQQSAKLQASLGSMSQTVEEIFGGIRTVKAFGNENVVIGRFEEKVDAIVTERMKFVRLSSIFSALIPLMASIGFVVAISYGGYLTINKNITLGDFVAFLLYLTLLRQPLEQLGNMLNVIQRASASLARISELLNVPPAVFDHEGVLSEAPVKGDVEVKNLSFQYPGTQTQVLKDISFTLKRGKTLGIIGPIGSGKTTLAHLLLRLYEPPRQAIFVDGTDVHDFYLQHLRKSIAYVPQNGFLFSTSILENIAFSEDVSDAAKVESAAKITVVDEDIKKFPDVYNTEIGERGVRLSGGQKQRVAMARMVYKDAPIHLLDDSLSAVDTKTERQILKNMRGNGNSGLAGPKSKSKTTIIISHRLSAVMHADEILILEAGRITERGSHAALLKTDGLYAKLWNMQSGETGRSEPAAAEGAVKTALLEVLLAEDEEAVKSEAAEEGA